MTSFNDYWNNQQISRGQSLSMMMFQMRMQENQRNIAQLQLEELQRANQESARIAEQAKKAEAQRQAAAQQAAEKAKKEAEKLEAQKRASIAKCPYCSEEIQKTATICPKCSGVLGIGDWSDIATAIAQNPLLALKDYETATKLQAAVNEVATVRKAAEEEERKRLEAQELENQRLRAEHEEHVKKETLRLNELAKCLDAPLTLDKVASSSGFNKEFPWTSKIGDIPNTDLQNMSSKIKSFGFEIDLSPELDAISVAAQYGATLATKLWEFVLVSEQIDNQENTKKALSAAAALGLPDAIIKLVAKNHLLDMASDRSESNLSKIQAGLGMLHAAELLGSHDAQTIANEFIAKSGWDEGPQQTYSAGMKIYSAARMLDTIAPFYVVAPLYAQAAEKGIPHALGSLTWKLLIHGETSHAIDAAKEFLPKVESVIEEIRVNNSGNSQSVLQNFLSELGNVKSNVMFAQLAEGMDFAALAPEFEKLALSGSQEALIVPAVIAWQNDDERSAKKLIRKVPVETRLALRDIYQEISKYGENNWFNHYASSALDLMNKVPYKSGLFS